MNIADRRIVELVSPADLVITADIPLAADVVAKGGQALNPRGELYTDANVGEAWRSAIWSTGYVAAAWLRVDRRRSAPKTDRRSPTGSTGGWPRRNERGRAAAKFDRR